MAKEYIQPSFNAGELAPQLYGRVDLAKYKSGAALLENFIVDYRGGASTRFGTRYCLQAYKSNKAVRMIPFQASSTVGYALEFGDYYIRFFRDGAPVLEDAFDITAATKANPCVLTIPGHNYIAGDWFLAIGVVGMTQLNGKYYVVTSVAGDDVTIEDLRGNPVNSTAYGTYISGGTTRRVYTLVSPYAAEDLALLRFAQNISALILTHNNYIPYVLTYISPTNWNIIPITFGSTVGSPTGVAGTTTLAGGSVNYSYLVTAVDSAGHESAPSTPASILGKTDLRSVAGTNTITWNASSGAFSYNVYKAEISYAGAVPVGASYGYIGNTTGLTLNDSNIAPDFSITPPVARNPFSGASVLSIAVTNSGIYTTTPTVMLTTAPSGGINATAVAVLQALTAAVNSSNIGFTVGQILTPRDAQYGGLQLLVSSVNGFGDCTGVTIFNPGNISSGATPANPINFINASYSPIGPSTGLCTINLTWGVGLVQLANYGAGYLVAPTVTFSAGAATAVATLDVGSSGNPAVPAIFQQRLFLGAQTQGPQSFHMSQTGAYYNFDIHNPTQADDAITATLSSGQLNTIRAAVPMPSGLVILSDRASWVLNGGNGGEAVSPANIVAHSQAYIGISDVPPIIANSDILFVQAKGSSVRQITYNFYNNIYTGTDISILSSHLFTGYEILEWAWSEEPYKVAWAIRNDGVMLTLTYLKEQEFIAWSHSVTDGSFLSVCCIVEESDFTNNGYDAVYTVVERTVDGDDWKYIELNEERNLLGGVIDAWCVDSGLVYEGAPATSFSGGEHLAGLTVTGLADGVVISSFVMPQDGSFTLATAASKVVIGLSFTCKLKTLPVDLGEPTVQGKVKQIPAVDIKVAQALGLKIGSDFDHLVEMKDLKMGEVSSMLTGQASQVVTDLVSGDARTIIDATYTVPGQYCIQQDQPYPATILGVVPQITVGDTKR